MIPEASPVGESMWPDLHESPCDGDDLSGCGLLPDGRRDRFRRDAVDDTSYDGAGEGPWRSRRRSHPQSGRC